MEEIAGSPQKAVVQRVSLQGCERIYRMGKRERERERDIYIYIWYRYRVGKQMRDPNIELFLRMLSNPKLPALNRVISKSLSSPTERRCGVRNATQPRTEFYAALPVSLTLPLAVYYSVIVEGQCRLCGKKVDYRYSKPQTVRRLSDVCRVDAKPKP